MGSHTVTDNLFAAIILSSSDQFVVDDNMASSAHVLEEKCTNHIGY